jgi:phosphoglycolate phosphatase-like HAD superfamily hydrolase
MATIYFDMDGTIADLYGVTNWLEMLKNADATPYEIAKPLVRLCTLSRMLNRLQKQGYKLGVISWLAKNSSTEYDEAVAATKREWLARHLSTVKFSRIDIIPYGTPKQINRKGILFDDEERNRNAWNGTAYDVQNIIQVLKTF